MRAERGRRGLLGGLFARDHYELVIETGEDERDNGPNITPEPGSEPGVLPGSEADNSVDVRAAATALLFARLQATAAPLTPHASASFAAACASPEASATPDTRETALSPLEQLLADTTDTVSLSSHLPAALDSGVAQHSPAHERPSLAEESTAPPANNSVGVAADTRAQPSLTVPAPSPPPTFVALPASHPQAVESVSSAPPLPTAVRSLTALSTTAPSRSAEFAEPAELASRCAPEPSLPEPSLVEPSLVEPSFSALLDRITAAAGAPGSTPTHTPLPSSVENGPLSPSPAELSSSSLSTMSSPPTPAPQLPTSAGPGPVGATAPAVPTGALAALGVPGSWLSEGVLADPHLGALTALLTLAPAAPVAPTAVGQRMLLVGTVEQAGRVAERLADNAGIGRDTIRLALPPEAAEPEGAWSDRPVLRSFHDALATVQAATEHDDALVVVVAAPVGARHVAWTSRLVACLDPDAVWGVAPAAAKAEDILDWAVRLGGVTALALHDLDSTTSPASALTTGIPIALLDGSPATPSRWAGILIDRLSQRPPLALPL